jgi:tRNA (cmo5U34)-methyltransferase
MKSLDQFNSVARVYDALASMVFGRSMWYAQTHYLHSLPRSGNVLILGGGTGWLAAELLRISDVKIVFVEASSTMLALAEKKLQKYRSRVQFIHGTELSIPRHAKFDIVITNFYLDLFKDSSLPKVIGTIIPSLERDTFWVVTDFVDGKWWQNFLLWIMLKFFRATCNVEARRLPKWDKAIQAAGFRIVDESFFYGGFIRTVLGNVTPLRCPSQVA